MTSIESVSGLNFDLTTNKPVDEGFLKIYDKYTTFDNLTTGGITATPYSTTCRTVFTGTFTANRTITLQTGVSGDWVVIDTTRATLGAYYLDIRNLSSNLLKRITVKTIIRFTHDGTNWNGISVNSNEVVALFTNSSGKLDTSLIQAPGSDTEIVINSSGALSTNSKFKIASDTLNISSNGKVKIVHNGDSGSLNTTGGAINLDNTLNVGAGVVAYTNQGVTANGDLVNLNVANSAFDKNGLTIDYEGTQKAIEIKSGGVAKFSVDKTKTTVNNYSLPTSSAGNKYKIPVLNSGESALDFVKLADGVIDITNAGADVGVTVNSIINGNLKTAKLASGSYALTTPITFPLSTSSIEGSGLYSTNITSNLTTPIINVNQAYDVKNVNIEKICVDNTSSTNTTPVFYLKNTKDFSINQCCFSNSETALQLDENSWYGYIANCGSGNIDYGIKLTGTTGRPNSNIFIANSFTNIGQDGVRIEVGNQNVFYGNQFEQFTGKGIYIDSFGNTFSDCRLETTLSDEYIEFGPNSTGNYIHNPYISGTGLTGISDLRNIVKDYSYSNTSGDPNYGGNNSWLIAGGQGVGDRWFKLTSRAIVPTHPMVQFVANNAAGFQPILELDHKYDNSGSPTGLLINENRPTAYAIKVIADKKGTLEDVKSQLDLTTSEPVTPTTGDRYINTVTGTSSATSQSVTANYIYEWNGATWTEIIPTGTASVGDVVIDQALIKYYRYNGTAWVSAEKFTVKADGTVTIADKYKFAIVDGTAGQVQTTNGAGVLSWTTISATVGGSNTQVQYNNAGAFAGSGNFSWDNSSTSLVVGSNTATASNFNLNTITGSNRNIEYRTGNVARWTLRTDSTAESGLNAGSNFFITRRDDAGASLGTVFFAYRSSGFVGINNSAPTEQLHITGNVRATQGILPILRPATDSTSAINITKADGTTSIIKVDTTNSYIGIGNTPTSTLQVSGSIGLSITTKTSNYTATDVDYTILADGTSATVDITLPTAVGITRIYVIKAINITNTVRVLTTLSQTIDGATTYTFGVQNQSIVVQSDGSNWQIINSHLSI